MRKLWYEYAIWFTFDGGSGRTKVYRQQRISKYDDLVELDKYLREQNKDKFMNSHTISVRDYKIMRRVSEEVVKKECEIK